MRGTVVMVALLSVHLLGEGAWRAEAQVRVVRVDAVGGVQGTYPSWSPDGERLAFERGGDLYTVELDGSGERRFVDDPGHDETPVWVSADEILFASDRAGELDVYRVRPDGSELERLTDDPTDDDHPRPGPNGGEIVFNSKRHDGETYQIWRMNRDGTGVRRLTVHSEWDSYPSISRDGRRLLWRRVLSQDGRRNSEVFVMDLTDRTATNLTKHPGFDGYPVWSPDEEWIAFASGRDSEGLDQLFVMRSDGSEVTRLNALEPGVQYARPSWSFDGSRIAATREQDGITTLVVFTLEGVGGAGEGERVAHVSRWQ
jgi:Tol biopolymer transport system component